MILFVCGASYSPSTFPVYSHLWLTCYIQHFLPKLNTCIFLCSGLPALQLGFMYHWWGLPKKRLLLVWMKKKYMFVDYVLLEKGEQWCWCFWHKETKLQWLWERRAAKYPGYLRIVTSLTLVQINSILLFCVFRMSNPINLLTAEFFST